MEENTKRTTNTKSRRRNVKTSEKTASTTFHTEEPKTSSVIKRRIELSPNDIVTVKNGYQGKLIYKSRKTGERFIWESFGDEQDIELSELKQARNSYKAFFENNWFLIDDPDVIEYLNVDKFYRNALKYDEFESFFEKPVSEIKNIISKLSKGQKQSVAYRARKLVAQDAIDSLKVIEALEEGLSITLIDR